jgi:hypothetical protein
MPLVTRQHAALFNGVSQQPAPLRLTSQHEALTNAYCTVTKGISKRPGSTFIAEITTDLLGDESAFIHAINRDVDERYIVTLIDGDLKVYDLDGVEKTVNEPMRVLWGAAASISVGEIRRPNTPNGYVFRCTIAGTTGGSEPTWDTTEYGSTTVDNSVTWEAVPDYLSSADPRAEFAMVTVQDYTFIVNKSVIVQTRIPPTSTPFYYNDWFRPSQWGADVSFSAADYYNVANGALTGSVQTFNDLPQDDDPSPPSEGDIYKIQGYDSDNFASFYVKRTGGVWVETYAPSSSLAYDEATMPHALVREADGTFTFTQFPWIVRKVGDDRSNPPASFTGRSINDVFFFKNRLGGAADTNVVMSGAGDFGQFFKTTVTDLLDDNVVDTAIGGDKASELLYAVAFEARLMLFAGQTQFLLNVDQMLTPSTTGSDPVTSYTIQRDVRPLGLGSDVYFPTPNGAHSRIREYFVDAETNSTDATDITAHVPKYLPRHVLWMTGSTDEDLLVIGTDDSGAENTMWLYKFFYSGEDKAQSAWFKWELNAFDKVIAATTIENQLYVLIQRDNGNDSGVSLERFNLEEDATTGALDFEVLLDRQCEVTGAYQGAGPDTTRFTLPYSVPSNNRDDFKIVKGADFSGANGQLLDPDTYTWVNETTVDVDGNHVSGECHAGFNYEMDWEMSEFFAVNGRGEAIMTGRLQIRSITLYFTDTAFFKTLVRPYGTEVSEQYEEIVPSALSAFTGKTLGEASLVTGEPNFASGTYRFQPYCNSKLGEIHIINDSHLQCHFASLEWEGLYSNRAQA